MTFTVFSDRLYPVSERNTMKNQMTMSEVREHTAERRERIAKQGAALRAKGDWLIVEIEKRKKELDQVMDQILSDILKK